MWRRAWGAQGRPLLSCVPAPRWPALGRLHAGCSWRGTGPSKGGFSAEGLCWDDLGAGSQLGGVSTRLAGAAEGSVTSHAETPVSSLCTHMQVTAV